MTIYLSSKIPKRVKQFGLSAEFMKRAAFNFSLGSIKTYPMKEFPLSHPRVNNESQEGSNE